MNNNGWIKLHRKILDNPISQKPAWAWLWVILLMLANHDEKNSFIWNGKKIQQQKGQFITGRKKLKEISRIPETTIERILNYLESEHQIGQQKTRKYRLITILNWNQYQNVDIKTDTKRTTDGQQTDTIKNVKNIRSKEETHTGEEKSQTNKEIAEVIASFSPVNPSYRKWFAIPSQRAAVQRMLETHGKDRLLQVISFLPRSNEIPYVPTITTPYVLEERWADLEAGLKKLKNKSVINKPKVAFS